jgi:NAD(P)H-hydrate epimerase
VDPALTSDLLGDPGVEVASAERIAPLLPVRPRDAHKGTFGRALLAVGSVNYTGAAFLAASGATRVGAGLVTLAVPGAIHSALAGKISEATYVILPQVMGIVAPDAVGLLMDTMQDYQALLVGSGLTQEKEAVEFVHKLFQTALHPKRRPHIGFQTGAAPAREEADEERSAFPPLVVDADALNALAVMDDQEWWAHLPPLSVLTPHPGEMARLMRVKTAEVQADRVGVATAMAARWGHVVLLKGAHTVVAAPDGRAVVLPFATSALATAGSGDVLAGAVVGLLAQGLAAFDAAVSGAYLHGMAGLWAEQEIGRAGAVASDLLLRLPRAISQIAPRPPGRS